MLVAQYKDKTHLFNRLTSWWTEGPYSHTEILFSDGMSGSASFRDKGVRLKRIEYEPSKWDFLVPPKGLGENLARAYIESRLGHRYDVKGLASFVLQNLKDNGKRDFCSEVCMGALGYPESWRYSPNLVTSALQGAGWKLIKGTDVKYENGLPILS